MLESHISQSSTPGPPISVSMTSGKLLNVSIAQAVHLKTVSNENTHLQLL